MVGHTFFSPGRKEYSKKAKEIFHYPLLFYFPLLAKNSRNHLAHSSLLLLRRPASQPASQVCPPRWRRCCGLDRACLRTASRRILATCAVSRTMIRMRRGEEPTGTCVSFVVALALAFGIAGYATRVVLSLGPLFLLLCLSLALSSLSFALCFTSCCSRPFFATCPILLHLQLSVSLSVPGMTILSASPSRKKEKSVYLGDLSAVVLSPCPNFSCFDIYRLLCGYVRWRLTSPQNICTFALIFPGPTYSPLLLPRNCSAAAT